MKLSRKVGVGVLSAVGTLFLLEIGLQIREARREASEAPKKHQLVESGALFGLNPDYPEINSQGVRDDEVLIPKPEGTYRILVLGDSVAYGGQVPRSGTFPNLLESRLQSIPHPIEVINAGVPGYTAYNDLEYYVTDGREFEPDLVVVAFCMNDVANPRLHWVHAKDKLTEIPERAIPNHAYDRTHAIPRLAELDRRREQVGFLARHSALYRALRLKIGDRPFREDPLAKMRVAETPTFITGEDPLSIDVLLRRDSEEFKWLCSIYEELNRAVLADRARLVVVLFPLAYQLDEDYPFFPQDNLSWFCETGGIPCIDLLDVLEGRNKRDVFQYDRGRYVDVWHLTELGHQLSANGLLEGLQAGDLIPKASQEE